MTPNRERKDGVMRAASWTREQQGRWLAAAGLAVLAVLSAYYLREAVVFRFFKPGMLGPTLLNKQLWFSLHLTFALPVLVLPFAQFHTGLRRARPAVHRRIGQVWMMCAAAAAATAMWLGITSDYVGSRVPLGLLAGVWMFFIAAAWWTARRRDIAAHRLFAIRAYNLALVFVWLRLMEEVPYKVAFPLMSEELAGNTHEWLSWIVPLLAVELIFNWWPAMRGRRPARARSSPPGRAAAHATPGDPSP